MPGGCWWSFRGVQTQALDALPHDGLTYRLTYGLTYGLTYELTYELCCVQAAAPLKGTVMLGELVCDKEGGGVAAWRLLATDVVTAATFHPPTDAVHRLLWSRPQPSTHPLTRATDYCPPATVPPSSGCQLTHPPSLRSSRSMARRRLPSHFRSGSPFWSPKSSILDAPPASTPPPRSSASARRIATV